MPRFVVVLVAVMMGGAAFAQSSAPRSHPKPQKSAPAAPAAEDPTDVSNVPRNVQKWVGSTVDDILTGTDKTLGDGQR